jgi:hypothetical protein
MMRFKQFLALDEAFRYGNFCGPGPYLDKKTCMTLKDGSPAPQPINQVDASCKQHDIDYCRCNAGSLSGVVGFGNNCTGKADQRLAKTLDQLIQSKKLDPSQARAAHIIKGYFGAHNTVRGWRDALVGNEPDDPNEQQPIGSTVMKMAGRMFGLR